MIIVAMASDRTCGGTRSNSTNYGGIVTMRLAKAIEAKFARTIELSESSKMTCAKIKEN